MARLIELPDLIKDDGETLSLSLMVLEASYKNDDIIPLLRPELLIKMERLNEASMLLEDIIKNKTRKLLCMGKTAFIIYADGRLSETNG